MLLSSSVRKPCRNCWMHSSTRRGAGRSRSCDALRNCAIHGAIRLMLDAQGQDSAALQYWAQEGLERLGLNMVYLRPD